MLYCAVCMYMERTNGSVPKKQAPFDIRQRRLCRDDGNTSRMYITYAHGSIALRVVLYCSVRIRGCGFGARYIVGGVRLWGGLVLDWVEGVYGFFV